jgi:hypothetical protein
MAGRLSKRHMRYIREEDDKSNKQIMDKLLIQMSLLVLREDPLPTGILDMFFLKISDHSSLCKTEVIYLKFHLIYN